MMLTGMLVGKGAEMATWPQVEEAVVSKMRAIDEMDVD